MIEGGPENQNVNTSQLNQNQFLSQVNDPELYTTMQEVIKKNKEKVRIDEKKDEEEKGEEKQEEDKDLLPKYSGLSKSMIQRRLNFKRLNEEFKNIFNKENSNINSCRRYLIHFIIFVGVINCCAWEVDCLFLNICYGEDIEMKFWISIVLFPIIVISIILLYFLYDSINYLRMKIIMVCIIIYVILSIFLIVLGIYSIILGFKYDEDDEANEVIKTLTPLEQEYYRYLNTDKDTKTNLANEYWNKMVGSGIIDIILGFFGLIVFILTFCFNSLLSKTSFDWRPPLRSHIRPSRVKKAINLYTQNYDSFLSVYKAENPHYQIDEIEAKEAKNRFAGMRSSIFGMSQIKGVGGNLQKEKEKKESEEDEDSIKIKRKNKKKLEKSEHSSEKDELPEPTIKKKKRVLLNRIMENNSDKGKEDNNKKGEEENNHHENNHVNNHVNNHIEQEINTDIKDINNKIDEI